MVGDEELEAALARLPGAGEPERPEACLSAGDLAAYAEGSCTAAERRRLEEHLASCGACLGELHGAPRWLDAPPRAVPPEQRRRAGALEPARAKPPARLWLSVAAGVALAAAATPLLLGPAARDPASATVADRARLGRPVQRSGDAFARRSVGEPRRLRVTGSLRLTPALHALIRSASTRAAGRAALLAHLEASPLRIPAAEVSRVEIAPELSADEGVVEVEVTLHADGRLVLRRAR